MISAYVFIKQYIDDITGISCGVGTYLVVSPYHVLFNWETWITLGFNLLCTALSAFVSWGVVHLLKKHIEKPKKRKPKKQ